ncbi:MAG: hypothetical protein R2854_29190 [Caldilineaceae bacterium]
MVRTGGCVGIAPTTSARGRVLKRAIPSILHEQPDLAWLVVEGGTYAELWSGPATKAGIGVIRMGAERWRRELLLAREQRSGAAAKTHADDQPAAPSPGRRPAPRCRCVTTPPKPS